MPHSAGTFRLDDDGIIRSFASGAEVGMALLVNAMADEPACAMDRVAHGYCLVRSGWSPHGEDRPLWLGDSRGRFEAFAHRFEELCTTRGATPTLWPRVGDVISDVPSTLSFLRGARGRWKFVLDVERLIAPAMRAKLEDHVRRMCDALAGHADLWALVCPGEHVLGEVLGRELARASAAPNVLELMGTW